MVASDHLYDYTQGLRRLDRRSGVFSWRVGERDEAYPLPALPAVGSRHAQRTIPLGGESVNVLVHGPLHAFVVNERQNNLRCSLCDLEAAVLAIYSGLGS